ncbi:MAG: type IX secretion system membrane protein PorP/SprF [Bacteroidetes bacterium]|nr:type IX secretion system membrane protein PorP/SprF [Bacteroidota bacterium]
MSRRGMIAVAFSVILLGLSGASWSQTYPGFSQYLINGMVINPAYAGSRGTMSSLFSMRKQWSQVTGAPVFQTASLHAPMKNDRVALGFLYNRQTYGVTELQNIYGVYAYHVRIGEARLSFGIQAGVDINNSDFAGVNTANPNDPAFTEGVGYSVLPNVGAGIYLYSNTMFIGASVPALLSYRETGSPAAFTPYHSVENYDMIFLTGGLVTFSERFRFKPSLLLKYSLTKPVEIDINGNFIIADLLWLGASYRLSEESLIGIIEMQATQQIKIGYSYDYQLGNLSSFSKGTHEVLLRLEFGYRVSAASPRYF